MVELTSLWLPVLLSTVFVFFASFILNMVLPFHRADYDKLDGEDSILDSLRVQNTGAGNYLLPHCVTPEQRKSKENQAKLERGPIVFMTVIPNVAMGKNLAQWIVQSLVLGVLVAYLASHTLDAGADYREVFRVVGTASFLGYAGSEASNAIWMGRKWSTTGRYIVDGLIYALLTAGTFGWLWP
jgi:hypothetical protein